MNERIENIRRALPEGVDALMVCDEVSRQYFTGFHSTAGVLVITREESCFFIDFRYIIAARSAVEPQGIRVVEQKRLFLQLKEMFERCQVKKSGPAERLYPHQRLAAVSEGAGPGGDRFSAPAGPGGPLPAGGEGPDGGRLHPQGAADHRPRL